MPQDAVGEAAVGCIDVNTRYRVACVTAACNPTAAINAVEAAAGSRIAE